MCFILLCSFSWIYIFKFELDFFFYYGAFKQINPFFFLKITKTSIPIFQIKDDMFKLLVLFEK